MAIKIGSNFTFQGQQPNFERDRFVTKAAMKAFPETSIDDGHLSYCAEDGNTYQFKSSNSIDAVTGKWRVFKADVDLSAYATKNDVAIDLAKKVDIAIPKLISFGNKTSNIKILSIKIPNIQYQAIYLECTIVSRYHNTDIIISANTDSTPYIFNIVKSATNTASWDTKGNLYYFFDEANDNLELYYNLASYDSIAVKVISKGGTTDFTYNTDIKKIDTIPENAILVEDRNYGTGNLFFATPDRQRGIAKLRAIRITDLPDLRSKYATKEKAFTKDTASTEPGQVVAGPATTRGNLYLRKLIADDIPDLRSRYQPKYAADYIATSDLSTLPITTGVIDLNGYQIDLPNIDLVDGYLTIMNGTVVFNSTTTNLRVKELELSNVTISYSDDVNIVLDIQKLKCLNVVDYPGLRINFTEGSAIKQATLINSSIRTASLSVTGTLNMYNSTCNIKGNVKLTAYNSFVCNDGLSLANGSAWYNTQLDIYPYYTSGWIDEAGKMHCGMYFDDTITGDSDYAPQTKAVYNAFQLKADKTQLNDLATKTDFVDLRNKVNAMPKTVFITQAAYNALTTKDPNTIYYING